MLSDLLHEAYGAMQHDRRRATLTMCGMAWGIATVILLLAYGSGFGTAIQHIFESFGAKVIGIFPGRTSMQVGGAKAGTQIRLKVEDVERLQETVPTIRHVTPELWKDSTVQADNRSYQLQVIGNNSSAQNIRVLKVDTGRFFNEEDNVQRARVAVLGSEAKTKLFSGRFAVSETIRIDGISFQVIGVLEPKMQEGDDNINRIIYIPFHTAGDLKNSQYIDSIWLDYEAMDWEKTEKMVRQTLASLHQYNPEDRRAVFLFNSMKQLHQFHVITMGLKVLLGFIGTLTLGIGGVGLMNIMLVSVQQRTREIGTLKALGARKRSILFQFLAEALAISFAGGVLGIVLAYIVSLSVGRLTLYSALAKNAEAGDIRLIIDPSNLLVATSILIVVGIVSGMLPAIKASRLSPIEALRYE
ncbi:MAG TPA: ABC transporter permease [Terriglobales bacterium]|nr:ABC transporter permease [Terriglobales bacterium]